MACSRWKRGEIALLIKESKFRYRDTYVTIRFRPRLLSVQSSAVRLVIIAPKRLGNAPSRNRCKRHIRDIVRSLQQSEKLEGDVVVFIRALFPRIAYTHMRSEVFTAFARLL